MHSAWHPVGSPHIILLFQTGGQERPLRRDLNEVKGYLEEGLNELLVLQRMASGNISINVSGGKEDHWPPPSSSPS